MAEYLYIEARPPWPASLELSARLLAARPDWDIEADETGLRFSIELVRGRVDEDLTVLEEACRRLERHKNIEPIEVWVSRRHEAPGHTPPLAAGPWGILALKGGEEPPVPRPDRLTLPPLAAASSRFWAGESLALSAVAGHLAPPPGAPETRGRAALALGHTLPLASLAAIMAGAAEAVLISDEKSCALASATAALNGKAGALTCLSEPFEVLVEKRMDWRGRFGLIVLHLSPYLAAQCLAPLVGWLAEDGVLAVSGFAPGPQTARLLRSAAKAGLFLSASFTEGDWAAMRLERLPAREELPPLTGSLVPALVEPPPPDGLPDGEEEPPDEESLMLDEDDDPEEE